MQNRNFRCNFCEKTFVREDAFMKHQCEAMKRDKEIRTPIGQAAWSFYQKWMRSHRRQVPHEHSFLKSRYYKTFIRFATFVKKVRLPDVDTFVWLMKERDMDPVLWVNDQVYAMYLEFLDRKGDPMTRAKTTVNTILDIAEAAECETSQIFDMMTGPEFNQLLFERRLSPWILLRSSKFKIFFVKTLTPQDQVITESLIRPPYWAEKFNTEKTIVGQMDKIVKELGL